METLIAIVLLVFGILQIILFVKIWGMTDDIREIKRKYMGQGHSIYSNSHYQDNENQTHNELSEKEPEKNPEMTDFKFSVGDLMIIKANENQFRISSVRKDNGIVYYFSEKYNKKFTEREIELFEVYWKK